MKWISTKQQLPEKGTIYLVYGLAQLKDLGRIEVPFWRVTFFEMDKNGKPSWEIEKKKKSNQFSYQVTHWMPLPPAPERPE